MALDRMEKSIMRELRVMTGNRKLGEKNLMEWSTREIEPHEGEKLIKLPSGIWVAYKE